MNPEMSIYGLIPIAVFAGLLGALGMTMFMKAVTMSGITNAQMIVAVGSLVTRERKSAFMVGMTLHLIIGAIFGVLYFFALDIAAAYTGRTSIVPLAMAMSVTHGVAVACAIVWMAEDHPLEEFRRANFQVGIAHLLGHGVYGLIVGFVAYLAAS